MEKQTASAHGITIEENTIIIAPSALHLDLYQEIVRQTGGCLNITVLTLEAYLSRALSKSRQSNTVILYRYALALSDLSEDNTFYRSRQDYDFLNECLNFILLAKLYDLREFPQGNKREKDLHEIIERLLPIELWVDEAKEAEFEDAPQVRILTTWTNATQNWWIERLKAKGAKELAPAQNEHKYYWTVGTPRKEMEAAADALVANDLEAESVLIALENPGEVYTLRQALESRRIPYTLSTPESTSRVISQWKAIFRYLSDKSFDNLLDLISALFRESYDLRRYLELYPEADSNLQNMEWKENGLIDEKAFADLQNLEIKISSWKPLLQQIKNWTLANIDEAGKLIMQQNPEPTEEDILAFQAVQDSYQQVSAWIEASDNLDLFIRSLDQLSVHVAPSEMKGVLIGTKNTISVMRPNTFYIGVDAQAFPGSAVMNGVFDESYMEKLDFPGLEERQSQQLERMKTLCDQPESLYLITPQADYEGNSVETSHELNTWLGRMPKFMRPMEPNVSLKPSFSLDQVPSNDLYAPEDQILHVKGGMLRSYKACPLKNLLRYSLDIRQPEQFEDLITVRERSIIPTVMKESERKYGRGWNTLTRNEIEALLLDQFAFARDVFPSRTEEIEDLAVEIADRMFWQFELLKQLADECGLILEPDICELNAEVVQDGLTMSIDDKLNSTSSHRAPFQLYEPQAQNAPKGTFEPLGAMDLDLKIRAKEREAFKLSYSRGAAPVQMSESNAQQAHQNTVELFTTDTLLAQNFTENMQGGLNDFVKKKISTFEDQKENMRSEAVNFAKGIEERDFEPFHEKNACKHCPYRAICRNAAVERGA